MSKSLSGKRITADFIYGAIGLVVMNAVLSLLIYPFIERSLGIDLQGKVLFYMSLANLLGGAFGCAANYGRLKIRTEEGETKNGEYLFFLFLSLAAVLLIVGIAGFLKKDFAGTNYFLIVLLIFLTVLRYYLDVSFRISLNYRRFMLYYLLIGIGYGLGLLIFTFSKNWVDIFLTGEMFGILFAFFFGKALKPETFVTSGNFRPHLKLLSVLAIAYFLSDFVGSSDRLLFPLLLENADRLTSLYYYASVVGKIMSLVSTPINGVLAGHLAQKEGKISYGNYGKIILLLAGLGIVFTLVSVLGSHLFVRWFYPSYYDFVKDLFWIANAGQVLFFLCNTLMVVVLRYTEVKNQIIVSLIYIAGFSGISIPLILQFGLSGMAYGILVANGLKFIAFILLGLRSLRKENRA